MSKPKVLLFDLGGVIVRWTGIEALMDLTNLSREAVLKTFASSQTACAYEIGKCDDKTFIKALRDDFKLDMPLNELKQLWQIWVGDTFPETKEVLRNLRKDYILACLSNTNALHWERLATFIVTDEYFDHSFASHLITAAKPDLQSYHIPIQEIGVKAEDIWFFDDTLVNVEAAKVVGMKAYHVDRKVGVIPALKALGLLT